MKTLVRCRACGYIMAESDVADLCPACGLPKTVFEPYKDKISEKRRKLIDLHIHPIVVHFPPVSAIGVFGGLVMSFFVGDPWQSYFLGTADISILLMPFTLMAALASGFFDGRLRFKKVSTPLLRKKIIVGMICFVLSLVLTGVWVTSKFANPALLLLIAGGCLVCNTYLGRLGAALMDAMLPG